MPPPAHPLAGGCPDTDKVLVGPALDAVADAAGLGPAGPDAPPLHATPADHGFVSRNFDLRVGERPSTEVALLEQERQAEAAIRTAEAAKARAVAAAAHAEAVAAATSVHKAAAAAAAAARRLGSDDGSALASAGSLGGGAGGGARAGPTLPSRRRRNSGEPPGPRPPAVPPHIHAAATFVAMGLPGFLAYVRSYGRYGASGDPPDAPGPGVRRVAKTAAARARGALREPVHAAAGKPLAPGGMGTTRKRDRPSGDGGGGGGGGSRGGSPAAAAAGAPPRPAGLVGSRRSSRGLGGSQREEGGGGMDE